MSGRFVIFGSLVSVAVHAAILAALSCSPKGAEQPTEGPSVSPDAAPAETPEVSPAVSHEASPPVSPATTPARPTPARPTPRPVTLPGARRAPVPEAAPTPEVEWVTYTVKWGDTLERLARKAGCSVSEIVRYNRTTHKKLSNLKAGQRIKLPEFKEPRTPNFSP